jgi:hypothetical protein
MPQLTVLEKMEETNKLITEINSCNFNNVDCVGKEKKNWKSQIRGRKKNSTN